MNTKDNCLVDSCDGVYITKVVNVITRRSGKKINVVESICDKCGDGQEERLVGFIRERLVR